jgi:hypothetical protein
VAGLVALAVYGGLVVALVAVGLAVVALGGGDRDSGALALGAAALGFGLTANALLRR